MEHSEFAVHILNDEGIRKAKRIKDIFDEAKSSGFNKKAMREVIKLRKMAREERQEQEELVQLYGAALGLE